MNETYVRFMAPVNPDTTTQLLRIIDHKLKQGLQRLHLLISSPGGHVFHGNSLYNFLRGCPIEVYTYNFGTVDSIGVVIYSAGEKRFCVPHARFLIHPVAHIIQGAFQLDEKDLEEKLRSLQIDQKNIARVIADTCQKTEEEVHQMMLERTTLDPQEAKELGLVTDIQSVLLPADADFEVIYETSTQRPQGLQIAMPLQIQSQPSPQAQSVLRTEAYSRPLNMDHATRVVRAQSHL